MTPQEIAKVRKAQALPGFQRMPGMAIYDLDAAAPCRLVYVRDGEYWGADEEGDGIFPFTPHLVEPSDSATAGCLLELLGPHWLAYREPDGPWRVWCTTDPHNDHRAGSLGWACINAALALGRWPGGER